MSRAGTERHAQTDRALLTRILDKELRLLERTLAERELTLEVSADARARLVEAGYEPALGARPLKRAVVRKLQDPIAEALVRGTMVRGSVVHVDVEGGELRVEVQPPADASAPAIA